METSDGQNLLPLLQGGKQPVHTLGVTEFPWSKSIRKANYHLVYYPPEIFLEDYPDGFGELYDLEADPWEMYNLYFEVNAQDKVNELTQDLLNWLITTTRPKMANGVYNLRTNDLPQMNRQRRQRYLTVSNLDGKLNPNLLCHMKSKNYL
ncbi:MAG: hypothetical protein AAF708_05925 [Deinococcota bacterium]